MWSTLWSILVCKIPQFWAKLPLRTAHHTFLESRQPELTKNSYNVLPTWGSQKKVSAHGLHLLIAVLNKRCSCSANYGKFLEKIFQNRCFSEHI